jgi:hypothetical protein
LKSASQRENYTQEYACGIIPQPESSEGERSFFRKAGKSMQWHVLKGRQNENLQFCTPERKIVQHIVSVSNPGHRLAGEIPTPSFTEGRQVS